MAFNMLYKRLEEKSKDPDCPYMIAIVNDGQYIFSKTKEAFNITIVPKEGKTSQAIKMVVEEVLRAAQHGFTETEYARAQEEYTSNLETRYNNRNQIRNDNLGRQYCSHFLGNYSYPSIEWTYQTMNMLAPQMPLEVINQAFDKLVPKDNSNLVIMNFCPENVELPSAQDLLAAINDARNEKLEAYVDNVKQEPLITNMPKAGKIVKETKNEKMGYTELTLSNGAMVYIKPTTFKDDEIQYYAESHGGSSLYGEKDWINYTMFSSVIGNCGLGNFSNSELKKALAGKNASVSLSLSRDYESFYGSSNKKDLETLFQLNYLYFTAINKDEKAAKSELSMLESVLKNKDAMPQLVFSDSLTYTLYNHDSRCRPINSELIKDVDIDRVIQIAKERVANAADFTFYFVGSFDEATIKPLIEQYIASLPSQKSKKEEFGDIPQYAKGKILNEFSRKMQTPQVTSRIIWHTDAIPYTIENDIIAEFTQAVLRTMLLEKVREDEGAAYSPSGSSSISFSGNKVITQAGVSCNYNPDKKDVVLGILREALKDVASGNFSDDILVKTKEKMTKDYDTGLKDNDFWVSIISNYIDHNIDYISNYKEIVNKVTKDQICNFAKQLLNNNNCIEVTMVPEQ